MNIWRAIMDDVGCRIRRLRKIRGMTMVQLAEKTGVSQGMISHIETGARSGTLETMQKIAEALGVPTGLLQDPEIDLEKIDYISQILHEVQDLSADQTNLVRQMISGLKSSR